MVRRLLEALVGCLAALLLPLLSPPYTGGNEGGYHADDREEFKANVQAAISRGAQYLIKTQNPKGTWPFLKFNDPEMPQVVGATALCGLALLECKISADDPAVQSVTRIVRRAAGNPEFHYNYSVCLAIMYLHRLHGLAAVDHPDAGLIRHLAGLVVAGQHADGGWDYEYPAQGSDHSNTQFAMVALWLARKYQVPGVDRALERAELRFRKSQDPSGGWGYHLPQSGGAGPTGSMTASGLLGLALGAAASKGQSLARFTAPGAAQQTDAMGTMLDNDKQVTAARAFLKATMQELDKSKQRRFNVTYYLWSVERVCKFFGWFTLDGLRWYEEGGKFLLKAQLADGSWNLDQVDMQGAHVDTAFALLFLTQSNLLGSIEAEFRGAGLGEGTGRGPAGKPFDRKQWIKELFAKLPSAEEKERESILAEIAGLKEPEHTVTLAALIPKLRPQEAQFQARDALKKRMLPLTGQELEQHLLNQDHKELRLAAARVAMINGDKTLAPSLIVLLEDREGEVVDQAHAALKRISGLELGKSRQIWLRWYEMNRK
jgi:hypothetical protein